jgi:hypothetical protein
VGTGPRPVGPRARDGRSEPFPRARLVADAYGLEADERAAIPDVFVDRLSISLVERRAAAGDQAFIEMLERQGGAGRAERRRRWLADNMEALRSAMVEAG